MKRRAMGSHQPGSHQGQTVVWLTPPHVIEALGGADSFDLDPCACAEPRPWPTARQMIAPPADGMAERWTGRVWLNPPYGDETGKWMARLAEHGAGTALIFARTETETWHRSVWPHASAIHFFAGRLYFHTPDGKRGKTNGGAPSALIAYGTEDALRLQQSGLPGFYVPLTQLRASLSGIPLPWRKAVVNALVVHGGRASLADLYRTVERPTGNPYWREQVRKQVQQVGVRVERGVYQLAVNN